MYRDLILGSIHELEGEWNEVSLLVGDRGGYTQGGISSRAYPHLALSIENGSLTRSDIQDIYYDDYYSQISGYKWLEIEMPELLSLLFFGKVHGSGIRDYTLIIQRFLNENSGGRLKLDGLWGPNTSFALQQSGSLIQIEAWESVLSNKMKLIENRVNSVGSPKLNLGVSNRVARELRISWKLHTDRLVDVSKIASISPTLGRSVKRNLESISISDSLTIYV